MWMMSGDVAALDPLSMDDAQLERAREAARAVVDAPQRLAALEAERQRRIVEKAALRSERDKLFERLTALLADYDAAHEADLAELERTPQAQAISVCKRAYLSGRRAYALAHDLLGATGDRRFHRPWNVPDQLATCGGPAGLAFMLSLRGASLTVEAPWRTDVERLRELTRGRGPGSCHR